MKTGADFLPEDWPFPGADKLSESRVAGLKTLQPVRFMIRSTKMNRFFILLFDTGTDKDRHFLKRCRSRGQPPYGLKGPVFTMVSGLPVYQL